ncbi:hypothetical protein SPAB_02769 [Salmonella enterica subsp. enterica serovar Paratyphi B str. SPB7]|uniref:Uncharacterized protein n=1 Tax=Salmonella paratyphi B (strain ATCC BAA-1250 / SPB7) TaxID=1016998 RepID=A0A6C6Z447_SALPB|nr:hypothetical protein SPAB_02769 [Salmonella enterica subsp. enterica serovar Paratyphi B str. SPB7]
MPSVGLISAAHQARPEPAAGVKSQIAKRRRQRPLLHWWVVQDDSLRSPFGPSP